MKIIHLFAPGPIGGAEKVVSSGVAELTKHESDVELWILREQRNPRWAEDFGNLLPPSVKVRSFTAKSPLDLGLRQGLKAALRDEQAVLHTHGFKAAFYGYSSLHSKIHHFHTHHGETAHTLKVRLYERLELFIMRRALQVHAVSRAMEQRLRQRGVPRVVLVENPLVLQDVSLSSGTSLKNSFLYVGRLSQEKGVDVLLHALAKVQATRPCSLKIIGDGSERDNLEAQASSLELKGIQFLGFQSNVMEHLHSADALVMPSRREGLPLTLIEALCSGLPVVASNVGGIPEFVEHDKNGLLSDPEDVRALAQNLTRFLEEHSRLTFEARQRADELRTRFSIEQWAKASVRLYRKALSHS